MAVISMKAQAINLFFIDHKVIFYARKKWKFVVQETEIRERNEVIISSDIDGSN